MSVADAPPTPPRIIALIAAHNEADVLGQVIDDLAAQGVSSYLIDHGSTDATAEVVRRRMGSSLLGMEEMTDRGEFSLEAIVRRKEELASTLDADWFINHDADELRESPWSDLDLAAAIGVVDRMGYNAIDFALLDFTPTDDSFQPGDDLRAAFSHYVPGAELNRVQVRCWKKPAERVRLAGGGHDATFADRRIFPIRFLLRHYPVRSQEHGERKVFRERLPRFAADERAQGWHYHYDNMQPGHRFLAEPGSLQKYDAEVVRARLAIEHRGVEELREALTSRERSFAEELARLRREMDRERDARSGVEANLENARTALTEAHAKLDATGEELRTVHARLEEVGRKLETTHAELNAVRAAADDSRAELEEQRRKEVALSEKLRAADASRAEHARRLEDVFASWSWRLTSPLRRVAALFAGRGRGPL